MFDPIGEMPRAGSARAPNTSETRASTGALSNASKRVIVVGAGLAGLACAERLVAGGCDVVILEATGRVGGRVRSIRDFIPGAVLEMGAEFVGRFHQRWIGYAKRFGVPLVKADEYPNQHRPILLRGKAASRKESARLWRESDALLRRLNGMAMEIDADEPWTSTGALVLDYTTLGQWLAAQTDVDPDVRTVAAVAMAGDNGVPVDRQSLLANLAMIKGGGMDAFWTDCEYYRADGGNDRLAMAMAQQIGMERIRFNSPVVRIDTRSEIVQVECADGAIFEAEDLVLATPASVYRKIRFDPPLPRELEVVQMGKTLKILAHVNDNFWTRNRNAPEGLSDGLVSQMWHGTDTQPGADGASLNALCLPIEAAGAEAVGRDRRPVQTGNVGVAQGLRSLAA